MDLDLDKKLHVDRIENANRLLDHIHVHHEALSAKIYPNLGGSIQELIIANTKIIDGITDDKAGLEDYAATYKSSVLFPFPNRIEDGSYVYRGTEHQFPINEPAVNNAIHGSVYNKPFVVSSIQSGQNEVAIELVYRSDGAEKGFPFAYELKLTYSILASGSLKFRFDIYNRGEASFPYGLGWHPYFFSDELQKSSLGFPSVDHYVCNERSLPVEAVRTPLQENFELADKRFDDAYSLSGPLCQFETGKYALALSFADPEKTYLQVYTPPHGKSIALEPMTCIANSFNSGIGLKELTPGESNSWTIDMTVTLKT